MAGGGRTRRGAGWSRRAVKPGRIVGLAQGGRGDGPPRGGSIRRLASDTAHRDEEFLWVSRAHARAAFDFHVKSPRWENEPGGLFIDVKATTGEAGGTFHMSMAEVLWASSHANYRIARISGVGRGGISVAILKGVHELAKTIMETVPSCLPIGIKVDGFEIETGILSPVGISLLLRS